MDSKRGVSGGYYLAKSPDNITLGEAIRFIEGPIEPLVCASKKRYDECKDFNTCVFKEIWGQVYAATSMVIDSITFAELVRRANVRKQEHHNYVYTI